MASVLSSRSCVSRAVRVNVARPRTCQPRRMVLVRAEPVVEKTATAAPDDLSSKIIGIIATQLAVEADKITPESKFVDLGADSLDTVEIMMALEEQFDISLDEEGAEKIANVADATALIRAAIEAK